MAGEKSAGHIDTDDGRFRVETDSMGEVKVPGNAYWGAQTQRAVENFSVSDLRIPVALVRALGRVKQAAAAVNGALGLLEPRIAEAIGKAAEEVAQDVFLQLHAKLVGLENGEHVMFWLRRTASHRSIDYARRVRPGTVGLEEAPELSVDGDPGDPMLRDRLRTLIASLPEAPRMAMILRYQEELMPEEIARVMDMPVSTVKSHLQRSLAMLREKIGRSMGEIR